MTFIYFEETYSKETKPSANHHIIIFISSFNLIIHLKIHLTNNLASRSCSDIAYCTDNSVVICATLCNRVFQYYRKGFYDLKF